MRFLGKTALTLTAIIALATAKLEAQNNNTFPRDTTINGTEYSIIGEKHIQTPDSVKRIFTQDNPKYQEFLNNGIDIPAYLLDRQSMAKLNELILKSDSVHLTRTGNLTLSANGSLQANTLASFNIDGKYIADHPNEFENVLALMETLIPKPYISWEETVPITGPIGSNCENVIIPGNNYKELVMVKKDKKKDVKKKDKKDDCDIFDWGFGYATNVTSDLNGQPNHYITANTLIDNKVELYAGIDLLSGREVSNDSTQSTTTVQPNEDFYVDINQRNYSNVKNNFNWLVGANVFFGNNNTAFGLGAGYNSTSTTTNNSFKELNHRVYQIVAGQEQDIDRGDENVSLAKHFSDPVVTKKNYLFFGPRVNIMGEKANITLGANMYLNKDNTTKTITPSFGFSTSLTF